MEVLNTKNFISDSGSAAVSEGQMMRENSLMAGKQASNHSADIYSSVATPADDASEALIPARNDVFNKNSSTIHQSSFGLIYWFISFHLLPFDLTRTHLEIPP